MLELRLVLVDENFLVGEADGTVSSLGSMSSAGGDGENLRWRPRRRQRRRILLTILA